MSRASCCKRCSMPFTRSLHVGSWRTSCCSVATACCACAAHGKYVGTVLGDPCKITHGYTYLDEGNRVRNRFDSLGLLPGYDLQLLHTFHQNAH